MLHTPGAISPVPFKNTSDLQSEPIKAAQIHSDCASDSTLSDHHTRKTYPRHAKVRITHRNRLYRMKAVHPRNQIRLIQSIERMLQQQAPVSPHPASLTSMPIEQKKDLLQQLRKRVSVIEDTIGKANEALHVLLQFL